MDNNTALDDAVAGLYRAAAGLDSWADALAAAAAVLGGDEPALRLALDAAVADLPTPAGSASADGADLAVALQTDAARRIAFHLREAVLTRQARTRQSGLGAALIGLLRFPVLLLEAGCRIRYHNAAAARELDGGGPLLRRDGRLVGRDKAVDAHVQGYLHAAGRHGGDAGIAFVERGPGGRGGRIALQSIATTLGGKPLCMLLLHDVDGARLPAAATLAQVYRLTPAQAGVTLALLRGLTADEVAAERAVSSYTVRDQIAAVFAKAGVARQAELVARIAALPSALLGLE